MCHYRFSIVHHIFAYLPEGAYLSTVNTNICYEVMKQLRTCDNGHKYYKSSDCPVCPVCEQERKPKNNFLSLLSAPARRALENKGIASLQQLSSFREAEILKLHGMGPGSLPKLRSALSTVGLSFKK